jgi:uncharacterized protein (DUF924 family)
MSQAKAILEFWFGQPDELGYGKPQEFWFSKKPDFDEELRTRFFKDYQKAAAGYLDEWIDSPDTCLALILLLDQFPRNIFRDTPKAFATDWEALSAAQHAVAQGYSRIAQSFNLTVKGLGDNLKQSFHPPALSIQLRYQDGVSITRK